MKQLTVAAEAALVKKELDNAVDWMRRVKGIKDPKLIEAYRAGMENGLGTAIARLSQAGYLDREN